MADFASDLGFSTAFAQENMGGVELAELVTEHDQALSSRGPCRGGGSATSYARPRGAPHVDWARARAAADCEATRHELWRFGPECPPRGDRRPADGAHRGGNGAVAAVAAPATAAAAADAVVAEASLHRIFSFS